MAGIGYSRVSTQDQDTALQDDALLAAGVERVFTDRASGALAARPQLEAALEYLRPGDVLVVWRLDRLGRSLKHLLQVVSDLEQRGVEFRSLTESIDTSTAPGKLMFHLMGALAEFERSLLRERTRAGLEAARARGRKGGRKPKLDAQKAALARRLYNEGQSATTVADTLGVSRATIYRTLSSTSVGSSGAPQDAGSTTSVIR